MLQNDTLLSNKNCLELLRGHRTPAVRVLPGPGRRPDRRPGGAGPAQAAPAGSQAAHHLPGSVQSTDPCRLVGQVLLRQRQGAQHLSGSPWQSQPETRQRTISKEGVCLLTPVAASKIILF